ncbi:MAG TPA: phosphoribosylformylglycinamidine synthase, partial [Sediminispirochaeta sp.]|nr:phosphoribosylformylglycinamidine synthase [Sediminispirochaeta sp.]
IVRPEGSSPLTGDYPYYLAYAEIQERSRERRGEESGWSAKWAALMSSFDLASRRGLTENFDGSIGAGSVLMPYGGEHQSSPVEAMCAKIPVHGRQTSTVSIMSAGFDPQVSSWSPYHGGIYAVVEAVARATAAGADPERTYLCLQEYFPRVEDEKSWGLPAAALLGAFRAQDELNIAAIGGKDSMSGSFEELRVPPTLVAIAVAPGQVSSVLSPELKQPGDSVILVEVPMDEKGFIDLKRFRNISEQLHRLIEEGRIVSARSLRVGGIAAALAEMGFGNMIGVDLRSAEIEAWDSGEHERLWNDLTRPRYGSFLVELKPETQLKDIESVLYSAELRRIGRCTAEPSIILTDGGRIRLDELRRSWERSLEGVFPTQVAGLDTGEDEDPEYGSKGAIGEQRPMVEKAGRGVEEGGDGPRGWTGERDSAGPFITKGRGPRVCVPVFPGTNCEEETAWQFEQAGAEPELPVYRWLEPEQADESLEELAAVIRRSHILALPGGFSAADEPDGSAKYIAAVLNSPRIRREVEELLYHRRGLILGICNGFQALVRTGLLPYGEFRDPQPESPVLARNGIGRHVSRYVRTVVREHGSPWTAALQPGEVYSVPVSHGEGRFYAPESVLHSLFQNRQVAFQYCDRNGEPTMDFPDNPNGSLAAIEGLISPDGRILGKMGHSERIGPGIALNISGKKDQRLFASAMEYFK